MSPLLRFLLIFASLLTVNCANVNVNPQNNLVRTGRSRIRYGSLVSSTIPATGSPLGFLFPRERSSVALGGSAFPNSNMQNARADPLPMIPNRKTFRREGQGVSQDQAFGIPNLNQLPIPNPMMMMSASASGRDRNGRGLFDWLWGGWYYDYPPPPPPGGPQVRFPPPHLGLGLGPPPLEQLEYCEELYDVYYDEYYEDCAPVYKTENNLRSSHI